MSDVADSLLNELLLCVDNPSPTHYLYLVNTTQPKPEKREMSRQNAIATTHVEDGVGTFTFQDGRTLVISPNDIPNDEVYANLAMIGYINIVRQAFLKADTVDEAVRAAGERAQYVKDGKWSPGSRMSSGATGGASNDITLALAEHLGKPTSYITDVWMVRYLENHTTPGKDGRLQGKTKAMDALRVHPKLAPILARMASERVKNARKAGDALDLNFEDDEAAVEARPSFAAE